MLILLVLLVHTSSAPLGLQLPPYAIFHPKDLMSIRRTHTCRSCSNSAISIHFSELFVKKAASSGYSVPTTVFPEPCQHCRKDLLTTKPRHEPICTQHDEMIRYDVLSFRKTPSWSLLIPPGLLGRLSARLGEPSSRPEIRHSKAWTSSDRRAGDRSPVGGRRRRWRPVEVRRLYALVALVRPCLIRPWCVF